MNKNYPIYTIEAECQDCYKCVRHCPVKAIKVERGHAAVMSELCVGCGGCVAICPVHAKRVRDDLETARDLVAWTPNVYVSLAPSWVNEFAGVNPRQMIAGLRRLGFAGVSETALGAQAVSEAVAGDLRELKHGLAISSACPAAVDYLCRYQPEMAAAITKMLSPALTHCKMLKGWFGETAQVIFIGPCVAKKNEADRHPELMRLALTFAELKRWLTMEKITLPLLAGDDNDHFVPHQAEEGAIYPVEGGMIETIKAHHLPDAVRFITLAGIANIKQELEQVRLEDITVPVFIETLTCHGGCIQGPCTEHTASGLTARLRIVENAKIPANVHRAATCGIEAEFPVNAVIDAPAGMHEITLALKSIGKNVREDELNCGGCGYETCRNFALALLNAKAEASMCVSYLRKQAQKKANALLRSIPSGVVIVDRDLRIIECNRRFAEIFGESNLLAFDAVPGMAGADVCRIVPFFNYFTTCLSNGEDIRLESLRFEDRLLGVTVFSIEPEETAGAIITDATGTELRREEIAERAREVITKNLAAVQDIACKLGENMAETEILLRSISENYAATKLAPRGKIIL